MVSTGYLKARCGYKLDASVAKAAKLVNRNCPNYCSCFKHKNQTINHWLVDYPFFNNVRSEFSNDLVPIFILANSQSTDIPPASENPNSSNNSNSANLTTYDSSLIENNTMENNVYNNNFSVLLGGKK